MARPTQIILSSQNLLHNLSVVRARHPVCKVMAMVKANAYGHGIRGVARILDDHVEYFGVASIDEALALRDAGIKTSIVLIEGVFCASEFSLIHQHNISVVFQSLEQWQWFQQAPVPLKAWLKIDTGMGRLGFDLLQAELVYKEMLQHNAIEKPLGIMSHFACADILGHPLNTLQYQAFSEFVSQKSVIKSLENSSAILISEDRTISDVLRPGLVLYGCSPFPEYSADFFGLKPVMSLKSKLIRVFMGKAKQTLGYGGRYVCKHSIPIGVVAVGYGDGYPITVRDGAPVLVNNVLCEIAGRISMDMLTIDLRAMSSAKVGDPVTLWGEGLPLEELAQYTQQHVWSILTGIQNRPKSIWF
ncbi:alanine racemase [Holospora obtusa F1]|uniref:Alanine racemase n=1 Tax=Holospora obtusa F1 TaxID=1399147 RepID=W6TDR6_HOLOB|nr:alanine racemase [Holospora obtusa]ETZ07228.1 alanine racemase [Holospora obtusa F1]